MIAGAAKGHGQPLALVQVVPELHRHCLFGGDRQPHTSAGGPLALGTASTASFTATPNGVPSKPRVYTMDQSISTVDFASSAASL